MAEAAITAPIRSNRALGFAIAGAIFLLDQLIKWVVTGPLRLEQVGSIELLPIFRFSWVENYGVSLGLLHADTDTGRWLLVAMTAVIASGVSYFLWRERRRQDAIAFSFVLGGALGNIVDRIRFGYVVDYADLHFGEWRPFLVFNVADAAITIGVLILLARALLTRDKPASSKEV